VPACEENLRVRAVGTLPAELTSVSGLAASHRHDGVVWAVEDSLEPPDLVALRTDATELGRVRVEGGPLANLDWEDLAVATVDEGTSRVYIADIGDNLAIRPSVQLYVFDEPDPTDTTVTPRVVQMTYRATDGTAVRPNAEALVVHEDTVWVIDKNPDGPATVWRLDADPTTADEGALRPVSTLDLPGEQVTGADLSPDGTVLAVRTTDAVRTYPVLPGDDVADTLRRTPCPAPAPPERQGESVAVLPEGAGLLTVSEDEGGDPVTLHLIEPAR
jgi:hypothetical protein